jgi:hypothetical protein
MPRETLESLVVKDIREFQNIFSGGGPGSDPKSARNFNSDFEIGLRDEISKLELKKSEFGVSRNETPGNQRSRDMRTMGASINEGPMIKPHLYNPNLVMKKPMMYMGAPHLSSSHLNISTSTSQNTPNPPKHPQPPKTPPAPQNPSPPQIQSSSPNISKNGVLNYIWLFRRISLSATSEFKAITNLQKILHQADLFEVNPNRFTLARDLQRSILDGLKGYCSQVSRFNKNKNEYDLSCLDMMDRLDKYLEN